MTKQLRHDSNPAGDVIRARPEVIGARPEVIRARPEVIGARPEVVRARPEVIKESRYTYIYTHLKEMLMVKNKSERSKGLRAKFKLLKCRNYDWSALSA
jgi:hypothetical protein